MKPALSIVIPTLNEEKYLPGCLKSIVSQRYHGLVNIIVSDNGSEDKTMEIAKKYPCFVVQGSKKGNVASARKVGCEKAKKLAAKYPHLEEIIINTDADTKLAQGYFASAAETFKNQKIVAASGPLLISHQKISLKKYGKGMIRLHYLMVISELRLPWLFPKMWDNTFLYGANSCIRRSVFEKVGGWDERFEKAEDLAISLGLLKENYQINFIEKLAAQTSLRKFLDKKGDPSLRGFINYFQDKKIRKGVELAKKLFE